MVCQNNGHFRGRILNVLKNTVWHIPGGHVNKKLSVIFEEIRKNRNKLKLQPAIIYKSKVMNGGYEFMHSVITFVV